MNSVVVILADNHTVHEKRLWNHRVQDILKNERYLDGNLCNLFAVLMSSCDSETKNQLESMAEYRTLEQDLNSIGLSSIIKKLVYTGDMNDLNPRHNRTMVHMNLMNLYQEKFQNIQEFRNQYKAIKKLCKEDAKAVLVEKGVRNPTQENSGCH